MEFSNKLQDEKFLHHSSEAPKKVNENPVLRTVFVANRTIESKFPGMVKFNGGGLSEQNLWILTTMMKTTMNID